jgi:hypothetical protein
MTFSEVAGRVGLLRNTLTAYLAKGLMPQPDERYGRTPLWREETIEEWVRSRQR